MSPTRPLPLSPGLPGRIVAFLAAGLVLLLSTSAVSPALHAWLHDAAAAAAHGHTCPHHGKSAPLASLPATDDDAPDHECAVTRFSHGVIASAAAPIVTPCEGLLRAVDFPAFERLALAQPRWLHTPPQAPPAV